ncbi:pyridoxamine 5'-phosphate oxidase family protein [Salinigranum marinum]|uniref:pyridoxamine 5'-phosphate oxidase family protein n=1 Tax=Salinigranum marinum TaxID=1515595 RepID=UPI002989B6F5|nr:pyridoxamine 5'-phosphate oxidase family protein [Salinigranum marinum]
MSPDASVLQGHMMPESEIDQLLTERGIGVLSMANGGVPYGIPLSFGYDGEDRLYFLLVGHSETGRKVRYAEEADEASFLVFDVESDSRWRSAIVRGPLSRITPSAWDAARESMADNAYRPDLLTDVDVRSDPRVWVLEAEQRSGRAMEGT